MKHSGVLPPFNDNLWFCVEIAGMKVDIGGLNGIGSERCRKIVRRS
jgi:hypothetical protein